MQKLNYIAPPLYSYDSIHAFSPKILESLFPKLSEIFGRNALSDHTGLILRDANNVNKSEKSLIKLLSRLDRLAKNNDSNDVFKHVSRYELEMLVSFMFHMHNYVDKGGDEKLSFLRWATIKLSSSMNEVKGK